MSPWSLRDAKSTTCRLTIITVLEYTILSRHSREDDPSRKASDINLFLRWQKYIEKVHLKNYIWIRCASKFLSPHVTFDRIRITLSFLLRVSRYEKHSSLGNRLSKWFVLATGRERRILQNSQKWYQRSKAGDFNLEDDASGSKKFELEE